MAANLRSGGREDHAQIAEINVTPFIDIMLVLLIIFMVAAPISTVDTPVDLPVSTAAPQPRPDKPVFFTIKADKTLWIGEEQVTPETMDSKLAVATQLNREQRIFLRADKAVPYGDLMEGMNQLRRLGYLRLAFVGLENGSDAAPAPAGAAP
jgi:biopolymer transport protein ExbD